MNPTDVVGLIEGEPVIGVVPSEPGMTNSTKTTRSNIDTDSVNTDSSKNNVATTNKSCSHIVGLNTEDSEINEGLIRFDIVFYVRMKDGISKIIINIEAQKDNPTSYNILNRSIFYVSRLISSQKERDFNGSDYNDIKQVFSIWICMNMDTNSMSHFHLTEDKLLGAYDWKGNTDLINIILIGITNELPPQDEKYKLHRLLTALFSQKLDLRKKYDIIEREYEIPLDDDRRKDVGTMCNLGLGIEERATERATEKANEKFVLNMYKDGFDAEYIAKMVELSTDKVKEIIEKNNKFALV